MAHSKITAQGQISVPANVRRKLGLDPGSVLEWDDEGEQIVVRRAARNTSAELHRSIFDQTPKRKKLSELKEGIRIQIRKRNEGG